MTSSSPSASRALPSPDAKIFPAFGAGAAVTHAAGLGGKRFIDLREPYACVSAFILRHGSQRAPSGIEYRLGLSGLGKSGGIDVADEDRTMSLDDLGAQFMPDLSAPIRALGLNRSGSLSMPGTLGENRADRLFVSRISASLRLRNADIRIPASAAVFAEVTSPQFEVAMRSIPTQTSRNAGPSSHAALGMSLSLAGLKAGVSRGELG